MSVSKVYAPIRRVVLAKARRLQPIAALMKQGLRRAFLFTAACSMLLIGQSALYVSRVAADTLSSGWWTGSPALNQAFGCTGTLSEPPRGSCAHFHGGIDVGLSCNTPIYAPVDVTYLGINQEAGYGTTDPMVRLPDGHDILLAHARDVQVSQVGSRINRGAVIALVGGDRAAEGYPDWSSGCHLHFEVRPGGGSSSSSIDPMPYIYSTPGITGSWAAPTPGDGNAALVNPLGLSVKVHAQDFTGTGLSRVNIRWATEGTDQWSVQTHWIGLTQTAYTDDYTYTITSPTGGWPNSLILNFDVYANNGKVNSAHEGLRRVCLSGASCTTVATSPPRGGGLGGGGSSGGGSGGGVSGPVGCTPGQYQAAVFVDSSYGGACVVKGVGEYLSPEAIGLPNDSVSSIKVGSGANVRLCENANLTSPCFYYSADDDRLGYFDSLGDNTLSSMKVEGGGPTTGCVPGEREVAFFVDENYQGTCIIRGVGRYDDPAALGLPNDTISSVRLGARANVRICANNNNDSPCDQFESDRADLTATTVQNNTASSAEVTLKGGIALCDGTNFGGECKYFGAGNTGETLKNLSNEGFDNRTESVRYDPDWAGLYHIVLYTDQNQTGYLYHADNSVADLHDPYNNNISSIKIYKNQPPNARALAPANGTIFPAATTSVTLNYTEGQEKHVHVWNSNGYDITSDWNASETYTLTGLAPGTYSWQAQSRSPSVGEGAWSAVQTFSINTPPTVTGGTITVNGGTAQSIQVQAFDAEQSTLTLTAGGLPSFATFTNNGGGLGTLALSPGASVSGQFTITVTANDGDVAGSGTIVVTVNPAQPTGYQAQYFNNRTLSGTPVLTRDEPAIDNDWGGGSPDPSVPNDNFSARWTKTINYAAGAYRFSVTADDGVRLYIDGALAIDKWLDQGATTYTVDNALSAGDHSIKMEYYENGGGAVAKMSYQQVASPAPSANIAAGLYKLTNAGSGKVLDASGAGTSRASGALRARW